MAKQDGWERWREFGEGILSLINNCCRDWPPFWIVGKKHPTMKLIFLETYRKARKFEVNSSRYFSLALLSCLANCKWREDSNVYLVFLHIEDFFLSVKVKLILLFPWGLWKNITFTHLPEKIHFTPKSKSSFLASKYLFRKFPWKHSTPILKRSKYLYVFWHFHRK